MAGLLADRPPLVESLLIDDGQSRGAADDGQSRGATSRGAAGDAAPLTVPSGSSPSQGSGPTLQRQFGDRPPAPSPGGWTPASSVVPSGDGLAAGSRPNPPAPAPTPTPAGSVPAGLDEQGYPPLIARSVQRSTVGAADVGRAPAPGGRASPTPARRRTRTHRDVTTAPLSGFSAAISALQDPPLGPPLGAAPRGVGGRPRWVGSGSPARGGPTCGAGPDRAAARTGRAPATCRRRHAAARTPTGLVQRSLIAGRSPLPAPPATLGSGAPTLVHARGAATPLRGRGRPERESA